MFVTIVALLTFTLPIIFLIMSSSQLRLEDLSVFHGRTTVQQLSDTINEAYLQGNGSVRTLVLDLPSNTKNLTVSGSEVTLYLITETGPYEISHAIFANASNFTLIGSGLRNVNIRMVGTGVVLQ